jgi:hypothetical protein
VIGSLQPVLMFLITIPIAFWSPTLCLLSWIVVPAIIGRVLHHYAPDDLPSGGAGLA